MSERPASEAHRALAARLASLASTLVVADSLRAKKSVRMNFSSGFLKTLKSALRKTFPTSNWYKAVG